MLNKIDPKIINNVQTMHKQSDELECIIYANNYNYTKNYLTNNLKFKDFIEYPFINGFGVKLNFETITKLAGFESVNYITLNSKVSALVNVSKKIIKLNDKSVDNFKEQKVTVAVIDTGVANILDLLVPKKRIIHFVDFVNEQEKNYDDNGHGTFVTSILAGNGLVSGKKYAGINPHAKIISLKALDQNGETGAFTILKAMQWVYDNRKRYNIKVVCMSFGSNAIGKKDPLLIGAEALWNAGVCVVCAAGNSGPEEESIKSPGASSRIITVGALQDNRTQKDSYDEQSFSIAEFSSRGPILGNYKPDLVAPGVKITSASNYGLHKEHYKKMSGTSVATPMVAGVCSLLYNINPLLSPNDIKNILIKNCDPVVNDRNAEGHGLLNINFINYIKK